MGRILIAYFSRRGANYAGGRIVDLPVGNTEVAAGLLRKLTGGDLFARVPSRGVRVPARPGP
jgi:flavodoxin